MEPVTLHTDRLVLRATTTDDIDAIFAACQDPAIPRFTSVPSPYSREDAEGFVRLVADWWADGSQTVWAVTSQGVLAGVVGLHHIDQGSAELGYWTVAEHRGQGFTTEAARAAVEWGFAALGLARISWRAVAGNIASARIARAVGVRYEGTMRQAFMHGEYRDDGWVGGVLASDDRTPVEWPVPLG
ncbi:GNAT family N-acetyltransferase [Microbacterium sp.]|uniref:GNAT family N-acetyltransferase n=1 Tax=Microbacterium sp. TaxID=51671 RepID=UPI003F9E0777